MNRVEQINEYLKERLGGELEWYILFNLQEKWTWVKVEASDYDVLEFVLNIPEICIQMLKDMEIEETLQLKIMNARLDIVHDHVQEIYKNNNINE